MKKTVYFLALGFLMLTACTGLTGTPTVPAEPAQPLPAATVMPTSSPTALPATPVPPTPTATPTTAPTLAPTAPALPAIGEADYLDDRSTPAALMLSYFNAINRHEYLRAYAYQTNPAESLAEFIARYESTQSVDVVFGGISSEGAAGSIYSTVPMLLKVTSLEGSVQKFAACYVTRLPQPGNFGAPPITPLHIERGTAAPADPGNSDEAVLASACVPPDFPTGPETGPAQVEDLSSLGPDNYIDNRSGAVEVISSLLNAVNRKEYVRAYSYWQNPPSGYNAFETGYNSTEMVTAQFGPVSADAGAGQVYYSLPAVLQSTLTGGEVQTFAACYTLHLSQPGLQETPPFKPLGIRSAKAQQIENDADLTATLAAACD